MVAIAADNIITLWNFIDKPNFLFKIETDHSKLHTLKFFNTHQVLLTAGFDYKVNVYNVHSQYYDHSKVAELTGHQALVTAVECSEKTPMVITYDDKFNIKVWDIRTCKCTQTMNMC